ncbi:hypothetical protein [Azospirillum palustre]
MGTSTSHGGGLVPPWADGPADAPERPANPAPSNPLPGGDNLDDAENPEPGDPPLQPGDQEPAEGKEVQENDEGDAHRRERINVRPFREALRRFVRTGDRVDLAKAVRAYGAAFRTKAATSQPPRTVVVGANVIEALERLSRGETPAIPGIQLSDLDGQPVKAVTALLIQALAPTEPGFEQEIAEGAMADAMSVVLGDGTFSADAIRGETVGHLVCAFITELVFKYLWLEIRHIAEGLPTATARRDLETAGREVVSSVVERACDARRCAPMVERKSRAEIAVLLRDLSIEAARYMRDYR